MTISKCVRCGHRVWPWQRKGWLVQTDRVLWWHGRCWWDDRR